MNKTKENILKINKCKWAIFSLINNTKLNEKKITVWRLVGGKKITTQVYIRVIRKFRNEFIIRAFDNSDRKVISDFLASSKQLNFFSPDSLFLFQTHVKSQDVNGDFLCAIPQMVAYVDRRMHLRIIPDESLSVMASFEKEIRSQRIFTQRFEKNCFDISAGGLSFLTSKSESKYFSLNDEVKQVEISLSNFKVKVNAIVVGLYELEPDDNNGLHYKAIKICLKYTKISPQSSQALSEFVFQNANLDHAV